VLSDPAVLTYNSVSKSLARGSGEIPGPSKRIDSSYYATSDGEFSLGITQSALRGGGLKSEISFGRQDSDASSNPYSGFPIAVNRFGLVYEVNPLHENTAVDIPLLRTALLAYVDSTLQGRLLGGER
jgi:hypothetical protein